MYITTLNIIVAHVCEIRARIYDLIIENISLFDRMHEGLIVLSSEDKKLEFASQPAVNLLKKMQ